MVVRRKKNKILNSNMVVHMVSGALFGPKIHTGRVKKITTLAGKDEYQMVVHVTGPLSLQDLANDVK